jgi:hypothetical protein
VPRKADPKQLRVPFWTDKCVVILGRWNSTIWGLETGHRCK